MRKRARKAVQDEEASFGLLITVFEHALELRQ
jgi:hypothetical protein